MRPHHDAVGRNPTSPASAPRSPDVVREPLELQRNGADGLRPWRDGCIPASASTASQYAVAWPMVVSPGKGLRIVDRALVRAADERRAHAAMLVAERDLQVEARVSPWHWKRKCPGSMTPA